MLRFRTSIILLCMTLISGASLVIAGEIIPTLPGATPGNPDGGWAAWLQMYGGWAVAVLMIATFIAFYRDTRKDFQTVQQQFAAIQRESITAMQAVSTNQVFLNTTMQQVQQALTANTMVVGQQGALLDRANQAIARCENRDQQGEGAHGGRR